MTSRQEMNVMILPLADGCPLCDRRMRNHEALLAHIHRHHKNKIKVERPNLGDRPRQRLRRKLEEEMHRGWPKEAWAKICAQAWTAGPVRHAIVSAVRPYILPDDWDWFCELAGEDLVEADGALFPKNVDFAEHFLVGMQVINEYGGYHRFMEMQDIRVDYRRLLAQASNEAQKHRLAQLYPDFVPLIDTDVFSVGSIE